MMRKYKMSQLFLASVGVFTFMGSSTAQGWAKAPTAASAAQAGKEVTLESIEVFSYSTAGAGWKSAAESQKLLIGEERKIKILARLINLPSTTKDVQIFAVLKQDRHEAALTLTEPAAFQADKPGTGAVSGFFLMPEMTGIERTWLHQGPVTITIQVWVGNKVLKKSQELDYLVLT